jgi:hypothetical protein
VNSTTFVQFWESIHQIFNLTKLTKKQIPEPKGSLISGFSFLGLSKSTSISTYHLKNWSQRLLLKKSNDCSTLV